MLFGHIVGVKQEYIHTCEKVIKSESNMYVVFLKQGRIPLLQGRISIMIMVKIYIP